MIIGKLRFLNITGTRPKKKILAYYPIGREKQRYFFCRLNKEDDYNGITQLKVGQNLNTLNFKVRVWQMD